jgi:predicted component of type VI protein secretion system
LNLSWRARRDPQQASCININDHDLYHQTQSEILMPISWLKEERSSPFFLPAALHDITQPATAHKEQTAQPGQTHLLQQKRFLFFLLSCMARCSGVHNNTSYF